MSDSIFCIGIIGDEEDIVGYTISHLLAQGISKIIIGEHYSNAETQAILRSFGGAVELVPIIDPAYNQVKFINELAQRAVAQGADWIIPFDADECWVACNGTISDHIKNIKSERYRVQRWDYWPIDIIQDEPNPYRSLRFREQEFMLPAKIYYKNIGGEVIGPGNHYLENRESRPWTIEDTGAFIHHVPFRSATQFRAKVLKLGNAFDRMYPHDPSWRNWASHYPVHHTYRAYQRDGEVAFEKGWESIQRIASTKNLVQSIIPYTGV